MKKLTWHTEKRKVNELIPFEANPRKMSDKQVGDLKKSLERFNLVEIPAIDTDNKIIAGHQRLKIMQLIERGQEEIDVRVPNRKLSEAEFKEYNLRSNKNTGEWNFDELANFDEDLLKELGFDENELDNIFGLEKADDFDLKAETEKAIKKPHGVKTGDLWQLGDHKLMVGDATNRKDWQKLLGPEKFDFMFTDPPYRLAYCKKRFRKVKTKEGWKIKTEREYESVGETDGKGKPKGFGYKGNRLYEGVQAHGGVPEFDEWLSIANDFQNEKGSNVMIFENWRNIPDLWGAIEKYWAIQNMVIWHTPNRTQGFSARYKFFNRFDVAPVGTAGDGITNELDEEGFHDYLENKAQKLIDTYEISLYAKQGRPDWNKDKGTKFWVMGDHVTHATDSASSSGQNLIFGTKPIPILVPYIKILSPRNGIVMEPFGGSGSTIIASEIMKRRCRAIELSPLYAEVILARFERFTGIRAVKAQK
jgi:DNA modification methylase